MFYLVTGKLVPVVSGARVEVYSASNKLLGGTTSNASGDFAVAIDDATAGGQLSIRVFVDGTPIGSLNVTSWGAQSVFTVTVNPVPEGCCPRYLVRGRVKAAGVPVPDLSVELWEKITSGTQWTLPRATAITDANGEFRASLEERDFITSSKNIYFKVFRNGALLLDTSGTSSLWWGPGNLDNVIDLAVTLGTTRTITGFVRAMDGATQSGIKVRAYALEVAGETALGASTVDTAADGSYSIGFDYTGSRLDVIVRASQTSGGPAIAESPLVRDVQNRASVDLVVGNGALRGPSEYSKILSAVNAARGVTEIRNFTPANVVNVANKCDLTRDLVQLLVDATAAAAMADDPNISPILFYGIGRPSRKVSLTSALSVRAEDRATAIDQSLDLNYIPASFGARKRSRLSERRPS